MESDKKVWNDFRKGHNNALSQIYFQNVQSLFQYGQKFTDNRELIKDAIQGLFFDLIRTRKNLGETDNISFYLMASLRRKLYKSLKSEKLTVDYSEGLEYTASSSDSVESNFITKEESSQQQRRIDNALAQISPRQREIINYRYNYNYNYDKICLLMNLEYDSARKLLYRALKAMRKILDKPLNHQQSHL